MRHPSTESRISYHFWGRRIPLGLSKARANHVENFLHIFHINFNSSYIKSCHTTLSLPLSHSFLALSASVCVSLAMRKIFVASTFRCSSSSNRQKTKLVNYKPLKINCKKYLHTRAQHSKLAARVCGNQKGGKTQAGSSSSCQNGVLKFFHMHTDTVGRRRKKGGKEAL